MHPATGDDFTLVLPSVNAKVMDLFLAYFADTLDHNVHAVMMLDGAGWHDERALNVPDNVTLALLPPYSPELNPVERVWLYLRERFLSLRVLATPRPSSRPVAKHGSPSSKNPIGCDPSAPIHGS